MIKVVKNWQEIGEANKFFNNKELPKYHYPEKNWDMYLLYYLVESMPLDGKIIDLGCGELYALKLLYAMGFKNLYGIDLAIPLKNRLSQVYRMWKKHSFKASFHLYKGDLTKSSFSDQMFNLAICISVIEHGVNIEEFFLESSRLLKPGGILFITTDYWEEEIKISRYNKFFRLPWKIFSRIDIEGIIRIAGKYNLSLYKNSPIPDCSDKCIVWNKQEYTVLALIFKKSKSSK